MTDDRIFLKRAILGLLDAIAEEHPLGHQPNKAARYVLTSRDSTRVEIMFEKDDNSLPNLWCLGRVAGPALIAALRAETSSASKLRTKPGRDGKPTYGRHSALEQMPPLGDADLVRFAVRTLAEAGQVFDRLRSVTPSDLS